MSAQNPALASALRMATGRLIEYPYSTSIGSLNMILSASEKMVKENPERLKMIIEMHKKATDYAMAHPEEMVQVAMQKLGQQRKSIEIAVAECRTDLEDRRRVRQARQGLQRTHGREEAGSPGPRHVAGDHRTVHVADRRERPRHHPG